MLGSSHALPGADVLTGAFALSVFIAGAVMVLLVVSGAFAFRYAGHAGLKGNLSRVALVLIGALLALTLLDRSSLRDLAAERRALEARANELIARAIAPGSALACLDAAAGNAVEAACARAMFAAPEAVAAALAYVDARLSLLAAAAEYAVRDRDYEPAVRRLRRGLEADRFGLVAQVLAARGCNAADCADLKLLRETGRVLANMRERTFDAHVGVHAAAWQAGGLTALSASPAPPVPAATMGLAAGRRYDFPSASSIPPVSIMDAEPTTPPGPEPDLTPAPRPPAPSARRQSAREQAPVAPQSGAPAQTR
jgi:hypothetical protein